MTSPNSRYLSNGLLVILLVLAIGGVCLADEPESPGEPAAIATNLPRESLALSESGPAPGSHEFILAQSWTIGMLLAGSPVRRAVEFDRKQSIWEIADATPPLPLAAPGEADQQRRTFWLNSLRLALMNEDLPLWALAAVNVNVQKWRWYNPRSDYWDWRRRHDFLGWPHNAASEFFSIEYVPPPK
jgi:hypothetical protein